MFARLLAYHRTLLDWVLREELAHQVSNYEPGNDAAEESADAQRHQDLGVVARHHELLVLAEGLELEHALVHILLGLLPYVGLETRLVLFGLFVPDLFVNTLAYYFLMLFIVIFASAFIIFIIHLRLTFLFLILFFWDTFGLLVLGI